MRNTLFVVLVLAACGRESPRYTVHGIDIYAHTSSAVIPEREVLDLYIESAIDLARDTKGWKSVPLPRAIEFFHGPLNNCWEAPHCYGMVHLSAEWVDVSDLDMHRTRVAHELFHFWLWGKTHDPDYDHKRTELFVEAQSDLTSMF